MFWRISRRWIVTGLESLAIPSVVNGPCLPHASSINLLVLPGRIQVLFLMKHVRVSIIGSPEIWGITLSRGAREELSLPTTRLKVCIQSSLQRDETFMNCTRSWHRDLSSFREVPKIHLNVGRR